MLYNLRLEFVAIRAPLKHHTKRGKPSSQAKREPDHLEAPGYGDAVARGFPDGWRPRVLTIN